MNTLMWMCAAVAVAIFGAIVHSVATFRPSETSATYKPRRLIEIAWAIVPILIVIAAAVPSFRNAEIPAVAIAASE